MFDMPCYLAPDFTVPELRDAPDARLTPAPMDGVAPEGYHATSIYPEYFKMGGRWVLAQESRMDCVAVGNMAPSFRVADGKVRPLFIYTVDISEFAVNKLRDRGSLSVTSFIANAQDFLVNVSRGLQRIGG